MPRGLRDPRVIVGGAAALVVVVALAKGSGGGSSSSGSPTADTISSDLASGLESSYADVMARLDDLSQSITTKTGQDVVATTPTTTTTTPTPSKTLPKNTGPMKTTVKTYTIRKGDTLSAIAKRNKTSLSALKKLNPSLFNSSHRGGNLIHPGEKVRLS